MSPITFAGLIARGSLMVNDGYRTKTSEHGRPGFPILRVAEVLDGSINPTFGDHVRAEFEDKIGSKLSQPEDVLLTTKGTVGRRAIMPPATPAFAYSPQLCFFRVLDHSIDPRWLYYWLGSEAFWSQATGVSQQTDMAPYISLRDLRQMEIVLPPMEEQRGIAATLGALDDKIASNWRASELCLKLAQAHFTAATIGVGTSKLGTVATVVLGGTPNRKRSDYWEGGTIPWINSGAANQDIILSPSELITESALQNSAAKIMPAGATVIAITGATLGQVALLGIETSGNQSLVGVWAEQDELTAWLHFAIEASVPNLLGAATGAAQQHVNKGNIEELQVAVPGMSVIAEWASTTRPLIDRAIALRRESLHLAELRASLLPEFLSGRILVPEVAADAA